MLLHATHPRTILRPLGLLMLLLCPLIVAAQNISGTVTDRQTGEELPLVGIKYKNTNEGMATDTKGRFSLPRREGKTLIVSYLGYETVTIMVDATTPARLDIRLKPDTKSLKEVEVKTKRTKYSRKNNPAVELMRKVIERKKQTRLENRDYYQYMKYQKLTLAANDISDSALKEKPYSKHQWLKDHVEFCQMNQKNILPLTVDETVTQMLYRKAPKSEKQIIMGQNSTGINDLFETGDILTSVLADVFTDVNIYDDQIRLLQYPFTSPIGKDAIAFYRFYITDTLKVDKDSCIHLTFMPNNMQDFGFRGHIYIIKDSTYQVKRCELNIPQQSDVNFVEEMQITQEFTQLEDSSWVLTVDDMMAELKFSKFVQRMVVLRNTRLTDYAFDPLPNQLLRGKAKTVREASAQMRDDDFWKRYRQVELSESESNMSSFVKHLEEIKGFKYIVFALKALIENFVETAKKDSKFDFGPMNTIVTKNAVDGWRFRVSGHTTANMNKHWFANGYVAYGVDTRNVYYQAELTYSLNAKDYLPREFPKRTIAIESTRDVMSPTEKYLHTDKDNFLTAFKWAKANKMMFYDRQRVTFEYETDWSLKTTLELKTEKLKPAHEMTFRPMRTTELRAELHYAPGVTYVNTKQRRYPINLDAPTFTLGHTVGIDGVLGCDYTTNYTEARIYKRFWMKSWGKIDCMLRGGIQWNQVPYPLLCMPETNMSFITQDYTFCIINDMEFLNDRFASAIISWDFNGKLFNRIPLIKKLKWREYIAIRCLYGTLTDKNNPTLEQNAGSNILVPFPEGAYVMQKGKPYFEMAVGIHNIFKLVHVEYVRRLNYNYLPTAKKNGVRFTVRMTF